MSILLIIVLLVFAATQRKTQRSGHLRDESVAERQAESHRGMGRGRLPFHRLAALRGPGGGHHDV